MKHNIFMLVNYTPADKTLGITKKIGAEINAFRELGNVVYYTAYTDDGVSIFDNDDKVVFEKKFIISNVFYKKYKRLFLLFDVAYEFLKETNCDFAFCYGRFLAPTKKCLRLYNLMHQKNMKVLIESHAYFPGMKFKSIKGKFIINSINKHKNDMNYYIDYFFTEGSFKKLYGVPAIETKIGIDSKSFKLHNYNGDPGTLNIISVANETMYHAYDRLILSLADYKKNNNNTNVNIHLVGEMTNKTIKLISKLNLEDNVILYGKKYGKELDDIYDSCNMAAGPLGQHRMGGKKDTGLKTKEYLARGIPYFYSGNEMKELKDSKYIYNIPDDESIIDFNDLFDFYYSYKNEHTYSLEMHNFAVKNLSWINIMGEVISVYEELIDERK